jgi:integral membrane sensor domain MASE1
MFNLDLRLFNIIYTHCKVLGSAFGFGAFEGAVIYCSIILLAIIKVKESKAKKVKK